ncbi:riboflavin synthase [Alteribacillus bidgolensis]|uniref:Riboflavin synthase n=1 Tax=Alteribacillus bidgolensis TaxID=930129 RepID=A0A1G8BXP7_9BACI|nr:riboflavin synthase [Alteribacillus bidgolensis]SDH37898.1 riboflavin synthase alpha chain [Alteribacillus bidgolensis]
MFTGIIEEKAAVKKIEETDEAMILTIEANTIMDGIRLGDSISVNGVCLTVTSFQSNYFTVDVMPETIKATSLKVLSEGAKVNLERAMSFDGRFGGHFVTGHVDTTGTIRSITPYENAYYIDIELPRQIMTYVMVKGSVAVDGISLTVFGADDENNILTISIIPHTWQETILNEKKIGDPVNIEADMLMKYTEKLLNTRQKTAENITEETLKDNGFM